MSRNRRWKQITVPLSAPGPDRRDSPLEADDAPQTMWNGERTREAYRQALERLSKEFPANYLIGDIPQILSQIHRPKLVIRHDIENALDKARIMAEIEHGLKLKATYLVRLATPSIRDPGSPTRARLEEIRNMGHEIGLNVESFPDTLATLSHERYVQAESHKLSQILGVPIRSVSVTGTQPETGEGSLFIGNLVNATSPVLMKWALCDTAREWAVPKPRPAERDPDRALLQLVVRPAAWEMRL